mmetsp:Transcript_20373/g.44941  ORF Transcript_20373/g.44941 Transcript_20373/m.44941 type:complete len:177 (+) Transcript_20373:158-688(+)|eukprot:CAMPEP_0116922878 /NCGR_PEP_ID=MMETSP0467-20121206/22528_1 /TAXON_ID=283647 /ORGANISM="Mesodinium pulex, Strain SPMC105" /LENGTH=176 /DNA_ID=CAMNT_0004601301 /DNA_START=158 /DNA_END=688 /DNA_ORIENTATION=+
MAVSEGLNELGFDESDKVMLWTDNSAETLSVVNGCLELGLPIVDAEVRPGQESSDLRANLETFRPSILVVQTDLPLNSLEAPDKFDDIIDFAKRKDVLYDLMPELKYATNYVLKDNKYGLKMILNTSFTKQNGTIKLRNILNYFTPYYNTVKHSKVSDENLPAFIGDKQSYSQSEI